jgi:hypothetical protein
VSEAPKPKRERLAEALACVMGGRHARDRVAQWSRWLANSPTTDTADMLGLPGDITDPREAFEVLTQRLDLAGWVGDERRTFATRVRATITSRRLWLRGGSDYAFSALVHEGAGGTPIEWPAADVHALALASDGSTVSWIGVPHGTVDDFIELRVTLPHPATVADCVAFASDAPGVLAAEAIAREIVAPTLECPDRLVWRVGAPTPAEDPPDRLATWSEMSAWLRWMQATLRAGTATLRELVALWDESRPLAVPFPRPDLLPDLIATGYTLDDVRADAVVLAAPAL